MRDDVTKSWRSAAVIACFSAVTAPRAARADDTGCVLRGEPILAQTIGIYDAPSGGTEIAHFTGAKVAVALSAFPEGGGRATVETTGFRIKGFVRARDIPVFATRSIPVYAGHVWIAETRRVAVTGSAPGRLRVEKATFSPMAGTFQGWAPCDAFSLTERVAPGWSPPGGARGFVVKRDHIDFYSEAHGDVVTSVDRASDGPGILLWSDTRTGAWVHVEHHGDILLDAWARAQDLAPLPPGETMDQLAPGTVQSGSPRISLQGGSAKVVRVGTPVLLRASASDASLVLGGIDSGVEVLVLDVVAGWASVLPKALNLAPSGSSQFWVRAKDLGI